MDSWATETASHGMRVVVRETPARSVCHCLCVCVCVCEQVPPAVHSKSQQQGGDPGVSRRCSFAGTHGSVSGGGGGAGVGVGGGQGLVCVL